MSELVERLRTGQQVNAPYEQEHWIPAPRIQLQAADTIEAQAARIRVLRETVKTLRAALEKTK